MKFAELVVLLPCHGLEDFPLHHKGDEAESLLAAWSGLWHPALIAAAGATPRWYRMDSPPAEVRSRLIVIPSVGQDSLPIGFVDRCKSSAASLIRRFKNRQELVTTALGLIGGAPATLNEKLAADFLALGFARLQIELLARHRHTSAYIDDAHFDQCAAAGATAALAGDDEAARDQLRRCFDCLYESRKQHYPIDIYLIDLTLVADTTLGESLRRELAGGAGTNVLLNAQLLGEMARLQPTTLAALGDAVTRGDAALVGGDFDRLELPLMPIEAVFRELASGRAKFLRLVGHAPTVYGRRRYGLSPTLPQLLVKFGFGGAVHATFDDGRFPLGRESKVRWEGVDASVIDALAQTPSDAAEPGTFLELSRKLTDSMEADQVATLSFAHWPSLTSPWRDDLRRIAAYSPVLGEFVRLDEFFLETAIPSDYARFGADEYRSPYLTQAVIRKDPDPISRFVIALRREADAAAAGALRLLATLVRPHAVADEARPPIADDEATDSELATALAEFSAALPRSARAKATSEPQAEPRAGAVSTGFVLVNPHSFTTTVSPAALSTRTPADGAPGAGVAAAAAPTPLTSVPAMGYAWVESGSPPRSSSKGFKPVADGATLTGEHLLIAINPKSGGIHSVHDFKNRTNRVSQRLSLRMPGEPPAPGQPWRDPDETAIYAAMVADSIVATNLGNDVGEILSSGRLVDAENRTLATFRQRVQLPRDGRVALLDIELDPIEPLRADPWNSYYAVRFAWSDSTAAIYRDVHLGRQETDAQRIEAPQYIDIIEAAGNITLLTGGHPYHRRVGDRTLDTLLVVRGETARRFVLGIGVDLAHPQAAACELIRPPLMFANGADLPVASAAGWLFHLDTRGLVATHWAPIYHRQDAPSDERDESSQPAHGSSHPAHGRPLGFRARLLETTGHPGSCSLRTPWNLATARRTNYLGETLSEVTVQGDSALIDYGPHEWISLEAWWS